jgi:hypothetical protein
MLESHDWAAWIDEMPGKPRTLHGTGVLDFPTAGYETELRRDHPPGINSRDLVLDLAIREPEGGVVEDLTAVPVNFVEQTNEDYDTVSVIPVPDDPQRQVDDPLYRFLGDADLTPSRPPWIRAFRASAGWPWLARWSHDRPPCDHCSAPTVVTREHPPPAFTEVRGTLCLACGEVRSASVRSDSSSGWLAGHHWTPLCPLRAAGCSCGSSKTSGRERQLPEGLDLHGRWTTANDDRRDGLIVARLDRMSRSVGDAATILEESARRQFAIIVLDFGLDTSTAAGNLSRTF